jgi:hypothetical protein
MKVFREFFREIVRASVNLGERGCVCVCSVLFDMGLNFY